MNVTKKSIDEFMSQKHIAIAGVSRKKQKFGNAIYKGLVEKGFHVYPINPNIDEFEGHKCYHSIDELPKEVSAIVINTKNDTTVRLVDEAKESGIRHIWMQQGCAEKETIESLDPGDANIITGKCIFMFADPVKGIHGFHRWLTKTFGKLPN